MFSLRNIAASHIINPLQLPEVVQKTIAASAVEGHMTACKNIQKNQEEYMPIFNEYTSVLAHADMYEMFSKKIGADMCDTIQAHNHDIGLEYDAITEYHNIDEGHPWFAYIEYMVMRTCITTPNSDNNEYTLLLKYSIQQVHTIIQDMPVPQEEVPNELITIVNMFRRYKAFIQKFVTFYELHYSQKKTIELQKKYVRAYKRRDRNNKTQKINKNFYKVLLDKYIPQYTPDVCKKK